MTLSRREFLGSVGFGVAALMGRPIAADVAPHRAPRNRAVDSRFAFDGPFSPRVLVLGIGSAGLNIVDALPGSWPTVRRVSAHTDARVLAAVLGGEIMRLGPTIARGLDCGARAERGRLAALESHDALDRLVSESDPDLVFVAGGLGGGTFTGAAPVVARLVRSRGVLVVAVATRPFYFEGRVRNRQALAGLHDIVCAADSVIVVPNDAVLDLTGTGELFHRALRRGAVAAADTIRAVLDPLHRPGLVNVGFADYRALFQGGGLGAVGHGSTTGEDRFERAVEAALSSPFLLRTPLDGVKSAVIHLSGQGCDLRRIESASRRVDRRLGSEIGLVVTDTPRVDDGPTACATCVVLSGRRSVPRPGPDQPYRLSPSDSTAAAPAPRTSSR